MQYSEIILTLYHTGGRGGGGNLNLHRIGGGGGNLNLHRTRGVGCFVLKKAAAKFAEHKMQNSPTPHP